MNPTPMTRPDIVLLLQPWSTAITQTTKSSMAVLPRTLSHMTSTSLKFSYGMKPAVCDQDHNDFGFRGCTVSFAST